MKKLICSILISLLSFTAFSQRNEFKAMYSPLSLQRMDGWGKDLDGLSANYIGAFIIDYNRYLSTRLKLGFNVTYEYENGGGTKTVGRINPHPPYDYIIFKSHYSNKGGWFYLGPQLGYDYLQKENFRLGSLVGLSLAINSYDDRVESGPMYNGTDVNLFFHAELINFTWGNTNGLTGQLGFGHKGLVSLGYFVRW